jgi:histidinol phosphatase-like enzyme (inositol monophosphatase family)
MIKNLESYFPFLSELSLKAGAIVRRHFNAPVEFERKSDDSPVTKADREVELFLRDSLEKQYPEYSILGEEFGEVKKPGAFRWILDPIDGTKSFVLRTPLFGVMIALECDGEPVLGSIFFPIQEHHLIGSAETGTFLNGKHCRVSNTADLSEATVIITSPLDLAASSGNEGMVRVCQNARLVRGLGDCYGYALVARGLADVMLEPRGLKYYDVAPMPPILAGAGGVFTDYSGGRDLLSGQGLATNQGLHAQIVALLQSDSSMKG